VIRTPFRSISAIAVFTLALVLVSPAAAQDDEDDGVLKPAEPDFSLIALPTSLRLPQWKSAFRVTHRFTRPLGLGDFGDLLNDLFGLDGGAVVGLEFRIGIVPGGQVGIHRSANGKVIQFFGQYGLARQGDLPFEMSLLASVEGNNNFREGYSPGIGLIVTRLLGERAALHVQPAWVGNTNKLPEQPEEDDGTFIVGVGGRWRIRPTVYLVGEWVPRVAGYDPGVHQGSFGIEKRVGGHMFQLNFSNSLGTTLGQLAQGGTTDDNWYLGFNISRKFF
jgi:hypothetical protein